MSDVARFVVGRAESQSKSLPAPGSQRVAKANFMLFRPPPHTHPAEPRLHRRRERGPSAGQCRTCMARAGWAAPPAGGWGRYPPGAIVRHLDDRRRDPHTHRSFLAVRRVTASRLPAVCLILRDSLEWRRASRSKCWLLNPDSRADRATPWRRQRARAAVRRPRARAASALDLTPLSGAIVRSRWSVTRTAGDRTLAARHE
jgi:hypothetical protein